MSERFGGDRSLPVRGGAAAPGSALNEPVRIISDLHLGHRVSRIERVESLRPLISGAGTIIFNGDTWQEIAKNLREESAEMLAELKRLCREENCEPIFLAGNHDPGFSGDGFLELAGREIVITHGDTLLYAGAPWKREILNNHRRIDELWAARPAAAVDPVERHLLAREISRSLPALRHSDGRKFFQRAFDAVTPPGRGLEMIKAWTRQGEMGAAFCERYFPAAKFLLIGHFHWGGTWLCRGRRVINTGSFLNPGRAYWAEIAGGWLSYGLVDEKSDCRKGIVLGCWRI